MSIELRKFPRVDGWLEWQVIPPDVDIDELMTELEKLGDDFVYTGRIWSGIDKDGNAALFVGVDIRQ